MPNENQATTPKVGSLSTDLKAKCLDPDKELEICSPTTAKLISPTTGYESGDSKTLGYSESDRREPLSDIDHSTDPGDSPPILADIPKEEDPDHFMDPGDWQYISLDMVKEDLDHSKNAEYSQPIPTDMPKPGTDHSTSAVQAIPIMPTLEDSQSIPTDTSEQDTDHSRSAVQAIPIMPNSEDWEHIPSREIIDMTELDAIREKELLQIFASGENLAHRLAYNNPDQYQEGIYIKEEDGSTKPYKFDKLTTVAGLVVYIATPVAIEENDQPVNIKIVFRGTKCTASMLRDTEVGGAGAISFEAERNNIINQIQTRIATIPDNKLLNISLCGHSLGGADAQNCLIALTEVINENAQVQNDKNTEIQEKFNEAWKRIKEIKLLVYNSAGIPRKNADIGQQLITELSRKELVKFKAFYILAAGDFVQQTGEANLFDNINKETAEIHLLKVFTQPNEFLSKKIIKIGGVAVGSVGYLGNLFTPLPAAAATVTAGKVAEKFIDSIYAHKTKIFEANSAEFSSEINAYHLISNISDQEAQVIAAKLNHKSNTINLAHTSLASLARFATTSFQAMYTIPATSINMAITGANLVVTGGVSLAVTGWESVANLSRATVASSSNSPPPLLLSQGSDDSTFPTQVPKMPAAASTLGTTSGKG